MVYSRPASGAMDRFGDQPEQPPQDGSVLGLDNVRLELPVAGLGNRVLAAFVDVLLLSVLAVAAVAAGMALATQLGLGWGWVLGVVLLLLFLVQWGYFVACEVAMGGQSPGKLLVGLRVVNDDGGQPSTASLVVRNLLRVVDLFVGVVLMALDPRCRRLGDRLAGTVVVHERRPEPQPVLGRVPRGWGGREVALVEALLERAPGLEPARAQRLAGRVLAWVERDEPGMLEGVEVTADAVATLRRAFRVERV